MSDPTAHLADFVLKLKFLGSDDDSTQIRRIRLPRICNSQTGEVSYEELVGLAISFVIPERPIHPGDFSVKLTYNDVDGDIVRIGSSEELLDALDQYKEQRVLRITAEVKRTRTSATTPQIPPLPVSRATSSGTSEAIDGDVEAQSTDAGVQTGSETAETSSNNGSPMLQNVVESVVNIILNAAVAINSRSGNQQPIPSPVFYTPEGVPSEVVPASDSPSEEAVAEIPKENEGAPSTEEPPAEVPVEEPEVAPTKEVKEETAKQAPAAAAAPTQETPQEERPFVHGRHTCDQCLRTPIIGKRYHALNMSDYDLCEKCFESYGGSEIEFEAVELERDRHLQNRWHRRRERMNNSGNGRGPGRRFGPRGHHTRWGPNTNRRGPPSGPPPPPPPHPHGPPHGPPMHHGPPPPPHGPPPPFHPPHRGPHGFGGPPPPGPPHFASWKGREEQVASEEKAMATAIELSLREMKNEGVAKVEAVAPSAPKEAETSKVESVKAASVSDTKSTASTASKQADVREEKEVATKAESAEPVVVEKVVEKEVTPSPEPSAPTEEEVKSPSVAPVQVETVEDDSNEEASMTSEPFVVRMPSSDGSFSSEVSGINSQASAKTQPSNKSEKPDTPSSDKGSRESSFSSDAAGNGEIAGLLGETFDKCAEAIDAMVSELDRTSFDAASSANSSFVGVTEDDAETEQPEEGTATEGATILESVGDGQGQPNEELSADGDRSEGDWQVVSEDQQIGSDEELARAAQMIGSALFNSDMRSSGEMMSTLTGSAAESDGMSYASSALTSVPSVNTQQIAAAQRTRWASQLAQLRTLGIDDEARCVEILERLTAANIGCGSSDEVSVQAVVNELWK